MAGWRLYKRLPAFVLGFHGCDESVGEAVLAGKQHLLQSDNAYDWLGTGRYFWEGSPARALQFAQQASTGSKVSRGRISKPFVIGAVIDLARCCNLLDPDALGELREAHHVLVDTHEKGGTAPPENKGENLAQRYRDRATVETMHKVRELLKLEPYDTVRAPFWEGEPLYPNAGFATRNHIQIAVRNLDCILGYFRPIEALK
jgi:hypothetical protein